MIYFSAVCSQVESSPPDVVIENHHPNITVELHKKFELNCTVRTIRPSGKVEWKHNDGIMNISNNTEIIKHTYNQEMCAFISTLVIHNFTTTNEGQYTCNASHVNPKGDTLSSSDSVYVLINAVPLAGK